MAKLRERWWQAAALAAALLMAGCTCSWCGDGRLKEDYGRSVANNLAQQIVNPQAGQDARVTTGLTPRSAANALEKYEKSFKAEEKKGAEAKLTQ